MIIALTHPEKRLVEYANHEPHARFLTEELVPFLESELPLLKAPKHRGLMGASFGAVAALSTAWRYPGFYGRLLLQSGSFAFSDIGQHQRGPAFDPIVEFMNAYREDPKSVSEKVFVSCGTYEANIYENRSLVPFLQKTGMEIRYVEARDGHNWENWRDRSREGLSLALSRSSVDGVRVILSKLKTVFTADGAYDTRSVYELLGEVGTADIKIVIPPRRPPIDLEHLRRRITVELCGKGQETEEQRG